MDRNKPDDPQIRDEYDARTWQAPRWGMRLSRADLENINVLLGLIPWPSDHKPQRLRWD